MSGRAVLGFSFTTVRGDPLRIMCLGAHADDI
jgi:hypothetical protein